MHFLQIVEVYFNWQMAVLPIQYISAKLDIILFWLRDYALENKHIEAIE